MPQYVPGATFSPSLDAAGVTTVTGGFAGTLANALTSLNANANAGDLTTNWSTMKAPIEPVIYVRNANLSPCRKILDSKPMRHVVSWGTKYYWKERVMMPERDRPTGSLTAGATMVIPVGNVGIWTVNDICVGFSPQFQAWVTATPATTSAAGTITVSCGSNPPATALTAATILLRIGSTRRELAVPFTKPRTQEAQYENTYAWPEDWLIISKKEANTVEDIRLPVGGRWEGEMNLLKEGHLTDNEKMTIWGMADVDGTGANCVGFTDGLYNLTATHIYDAAGTVPNINSIEQFLADWCKESITRGGERIGFTGTHLHQVLSQQVSSKLSIVSQDVTMYGMHVTKYRVAATGDIITLIYHPLFSQLDATFDGYAQFVMMDPEAVALVWHRAYPATKRIDAVLPYGLDGVMAGFRSAFTVMVKDESKHLAKIENIGRPTMT